MTDDHVHNVDGIASNPQQFSHVPLSPCVHVARNALLSSHTEAVDGCATVVIVLVLLFWYPVPVTSLALISLIAMGLHVLQDALLSANDCTTNRSTHDV